MGGKGRTRGEREPTGHTKSAILLYLADNGECTFTQIRNHLQEQYHINSSKDVRLHLDDLANDDRLALIHKIPHGNGNANSYRIREGFNGLKKLHNFLNGNDAVPALMKTRYFSDYTASRDFKTMIGINGFRNSMLSLYESILDDEGYERHKSAAKGLDEDDRLALIALMDGIRKGDRDSPRPDAFLSIIDILRSEDIDGLWDKLLALMSGFVITTGMDLQKLSLLLSESIIPESQKELVSAILRLSPSSLDYLLNRASNSLLLRPTLLMVHGYSVIMQLPATRRAPGDMLVTVSLPSVKVTDYMKYTYIKPGFSPVPPIVLIARSLFVSDMVYGRLAVKDVPEETLRLIFAD